MTEEDKYVSALFTFCSESYSSASESTKVKLDGAYKVLKIGLDLEENNAQVAWHKYCELHEDIGISRTFSSTYAETIHQGSLDAFNECVSLTNRGLHAEIDISQSEASVAVALWYTGPVPINITGIAMPEFGQAECFVAGQKKPLAQTFRRRLTPKKVNLACTRLFEPTASGAELYSDWTRIVLQTDDGSIKVDFSPLTLGTYRVEELARMGEEIRTLNSLVDQLNDEKTQLEQELADERAAPAFDWIGSDGDSCESVCAARGFTAVSSGARTGGVHAYGQPYYVCAANAHYEGYRPGSNVQPSWAHQCGVSWGPAAESYSSYYCLCER